MMDKKGKHRKSYAVAAAVVIAAVTFGLSVNLGSTTLAAAVEGYISGVSGTSYEIAWQTENEAEITVYLEIVENGQTKQIPKENLLLQKDDAGNWGILRATAITTPPEEQPPQNYPLHWSENATIKRNVFAVAEYCVDENIIILYEGKNVRGCGLVAYWQGTVEEILNQGNIAIVQVNVEYGEVPNVGVDYWHIEIDLNTYQIVGFYEIAE